MASLREALQGFEDAQIRSTTYHSTALTQVATIDLSCQQQSECDVVVQIQQSYEMLGFPLNANFSTMDRIVEMVFNTGLHRAEDPRVEFAVAVHVHPYCNQINSVWVYVAAIRSLK